ATDPAQPFGASLPWPESTGRPARAAGAHVVIVDGAAVAYLERGGRSLLVFPAGALDLCWIDALTGLVRTRRRRSLELVKVDGAPTRESPVAEALRDAGFVDGYKGLVYRTPATATR
ncbi:MAG: putative ATP-dependent helicase, partial [Acidimicrobiales bacterium]|nr:putative ATP-dependent helicase [Acidimicrobiales bacterium]